VDKWFDIIKINPFTGGTTNSDEHKKYRNMAIQMFLGKKNFLSEEIENMFKALGVKEISNIYKNMKGRLGLKRLPDKLQQLLRGKV
tara:strand:- start:21 stop:278 length:258 start_codon:yes stop_codon:yes gene_type:complete